MASRMVKNKAKITTRRVVITEDIPLGRFVRIKGNGYIFVNSLSNATIFDNIDRAKQAMEKYNIENFGLNFAPIVIDNSTHGNGAKSAARRLVQNTRSLANVNELTREYVESLVFKDGMPNSLEPNYILSHQKELKDEVLNKIGKLIEFHNHCDKYYVVSILPNKTSKEMIEKECKGCVICDVIQDLASFLDVPEMSKIYKVTTMQDTDRHKKYDMNNLEDLAEMYFDFVTLRNSGYSPKNIAKMYGISYEQHCENYDRLLESELHEIVGRKNRGVEKVERRTRIDI